MIKVNGRDIPTKNFSGGEVLCQLNHVWMGFDRHTIHADLRTSNDVMGLLMVTDALRRQYRDVPIRLVCPYLPYARQDRVSNVGESLSLKVMCDLLNNQGYDTIEVWDVHSDVALALLDRVVNVEALEFVKKIPLVEDYVLVSPDAGAEKKVFKIAKALDLDMIRGSKHRDTKTGDITATTVVTRKTYPRGQKFLIVDDICDGGRTFLELAKELHKYTRGEIDLYVTHGIFSCDSAQWYQLKTAFPKIYCPNSRRDYHTYNLNSPIRKIERY